MQITARRTLSMMGIAVTLVLLACSREPQVPKATYTVDEYLAKPDIMAAKLHECANNPGELRNDPDCVNVKEAAKRQGVGSYDQLPPVKLSKPGAASDRESSSQPR